MIKKIIESLEEKLNKAEERYHRYLDDSNLSCIFDKSDIEEKRMDTIQEMLEIVQKVVKEYGAASDTDLAVVSALPSLYPLQPFEEEAIQRVAASAKGGGWIPCSERLPQENEPETALCEIVNITLKNGAVTVGWCNRYLEKWFVVDEHCDYPVPCKYEDVLAWMPLPSKYEPKQAPYQKGE